MLTIILLRGFGGIKEQGCGGHFPRTSQSQVSREDTRDVLSFFQANTSILTHDAPYVILFYIVMEMVSNLYWNPGQCFYTNNPGQCLYTNNTGHCLYTDNPEQYLYTDSVCTTQANSIIDEVWYGRIIFCFSSTTPYSYVST